jgi:hypothetical protein
MMRKSPFSFAPRSAMADGEALVHDIGGSTTLRFAKQAKSSAYYGPLSQSSGECRFKGSAVHVVAHIRPHAVHAVAQAGRWRAILKGMEGIGLNGLCVILWLEWASDPWAGIAPTTRTSSGTPFWLQFAMINFMCAAKAVAGELESVLIGLSDGRGRPMTLSAISRT